MSEKGFDASRAAGLLSTLGSDSKSHAWFWDAVVQRPEAKGLYYNGQTISLDGYRFVGCRFDNCTITVSTANFELIDCVMDDSNNIIYSGSVPKIIRLFLSRFPWATEANFPQFFLPTKGKNGSFTIGGQS